MSDLVPRLGEATPLDPLPAQAEVSDEERVSAAMTVRARQGHVRELFAEALARHPDLGGEIELEWLLERGRVVEIAVVADTTGRPGLADQLARIIRRWRFAPDLEGEFSWTFEVSSGRPPAP